MLPSAFEFFIRPMTDEDIETPDRWTKPVSSLERDFKGEGTFGFVAVHEEKIIGYVGLAFISQDTDFSSRDIPEIFDLHVFKDYRNQGIGRVLLQTCEEKARSDGWTIIGLTVSHDPRYAAAQHLYTKLGYRPIESFLIPGRSDLCKRFD